MIWTSLKSTGSTIIVLFTCIAVAMGDDVAPPRSYAAVKVPTQLAQWEITVAGIPNGPTGIRPIRISSNRKYECDQVLSDRSGMGIRVHRGTVSDRDLADVFSAARETFNRITFSDPIIGKGTDDAAMYEIRLSSGSRAMRAVLDIEAPAQMGFDASLAQGLRVVNRISERHRPTRALFGQPSKSTGQFKPNSARAGAPIIAVESADWYAACFTLILPDQDVKITVYNPKDKSDDKHRQLYMPARSDMEIAIDRDKDAPTFRSMPHSFAVSDGERRQFFEDVSVMVNQFELHESRVEESKGGLRCIVGIDAWLRNLDVEFKVNAALPDEWKTRVSGILELAHSKDEACPTLRDLRSNPESAP